MAARRALWAVLAFGLLAVPDSTWLARAPLRTRDQMESSSRERADWLFVYGTRDSSLTPRLRARARVMADRLFGGDTSAVRSDAEVGAALFARHDVLLVGGPAENEWTRRLAARLPVQFGAHQFRWFGTVYDRPDEAIHLVYPNPLDPNRFLLVVAGYSEAALEHRGGGFFFGAEDWRVTRGGELIRSGVFAQSAARPWRYDPALDRDRDAEERRFVVALELRTAGGVRLRGPPDLAGAPAILEASQELAARLDRAGLREPHPAPLELVLYRSLAEKGRLTRDTRAEHVDGATAHAALPAGRQALDLWSLAELRLLRLGARPDSPWLEPAAVMLAGRYQGESLAEPVRRLYFGRLLPSAREAATPERAWRSPLVRIPARALLVRALFETAGTARARSTLFGGRTPGTLDSLCAVAGVRPAAVEERYRRLADSLARSARPEPSRATRPWRATDGFQRGVCLAHAVSLEHGYLSRDCARELMALRRKGAGAVSLTPFGYLRSLHDPELVSGTAGGAEEETDEAVCEAGAAARVAGLEVWLAPHLWSRGGWVGELEFGPSGWNTFFERYREFLLHYALLAEREGYRGLVVGHELTTASLRHPDQWRSLIGEVRRVYGGTVTYAANWGDEVEGVAFWDALDLIGVSFYAPLAAHPTSSVAVLEKGAARALERLKAVAVRERKPVLMLELGYPPRAAAPVRPWEEGRGRPDVEAQRACYEAMVKALEPETWVAGVFFWKWFSSDQVGGPDDPSYSPRGRPAEAVMTRAFREWRARPVTVARP